MTDEQGEVEVLGLPTEIVEEIWPLLSQFIAAALLKGSPIPETSLEDVKRRLLSQEAQGWVAIRGSEVLAFMNTYIANTEILSRLVIENIAGVEMDSWLHLYDTVEAWAREKGLDQILVRGRKGWIKKLEPLGFEPQYVALAKVL
jgi:hypothetical protein